ncbi:MAG TPA: hypothetical protein VFN61_15450 [Acidimicrobiales bacterium]|nr:hypothetical protein [Acidimicrobiales bacterium]
MNPPVAFALSHAGSSYTMPFVATLWSDDGHWEVIPVLRTVTSPQGHLEAVGRAGAVEATVRFAAAVNVGAPAPGGHMGAYADNALPAAQKALLSLTNRGEATAKFGARVELRLGAAASGTWLVPGLFYGENRWPDCERTYPRYSALGGDPAQMTAGAWSFRCDRAATTAVFAWGPEGGAGLWAPEVGEFGENGLGFAFAGDHCALRLHFPFREEPVTYDGTEVPGPPLISMGALAPGASATFEFTVYHLPGARHSYAPVLRHIWYSGYPTALPEAGTEDNGALAPPVLAGPGEPPLPWSSLEDTAEMVAWGLYRWHYRAVPPVLLETAAFDRHALGERGDRQAMHVSWVSGLPYAYALLIHASRVGRHDYREASLAVINHTAGALTPGGTFWSQWQASRGWSVGWTPEPDRLHSRTLADAALFLWRSLVRERAHGTAHPAWASAVASNLEAACRSQRADGALPSALSSNDAAALDWRGTAGLAWVAPLAEVGASLGDADLLGAALRAGEYFARNVEADYLCGAPEDVDLAPTSEDGYLAVSSYMALYRATGDRQWVALASRAAEWMLTFRYTYNVSFSPHTILGHYGYRSRGTDQASPPNQHLHIFGLICQDDMAELSDATGDSYYFDRAREALAGARQFVAREDGDFGAYRGMVTERFYQTTCFQAKGMLLGLSHAWTVGMLLLACEQALASGREWGP